MEEKIAIITLDKLKPKKIPDLPPEVLKKLTTIEQYIYKLLKEDKEVIISVKGV